MTENCQRRQREEQEGAILLSCSYVAWLEIPYIGNFLPAIPLKTVFTRLRRKVLTVRSFS